ncbi:hypothetical protein CTAYLR_002930 [Chrysophaeum taylorii]|uniref:Phosphodiesterase n=1 Tax=Chrysophaeum taylorii TaxID=2483200 RepID=A0AAD7XPM7_9STRA|nr:hypothetical protein CTAYLR_002930 [Chrysophaeum taylorii]
MAWSSEEPEDVASIDVSISSEERQSSLDQDEYLEEKGEEQRSSRRGKRSRPHAVRPSLKLSKAFLRSSSSSESPKKRPETSSFRSKAANKKAESSFRRPPENPFRREPVTSIHARDLRTGGIMVVEVPVDKTIQEALEMVASQLSVNTEQLVLMAETNDATLKKVLSPQKTTVKSAPFGGDGLDEELLPDPPSSGRTMFGSSRFARIRSFATMSPTSRRGQSSPTSKKDRKTITGRTPRQSMTETMLKTLAFDPDDWRRKRSGSAGRVADFDQHRRLEADDIINHELYYYREPHERSVMMSRPIPWYEYLAHTELCRMSYDGFATTEIENINVAARMLDNLKIPGILKKSIDDLSYFIYDVCELMHESEYHNFNHVVDVTQCVYVNLVATQVVACIQPVEVVGAVLAALCHDLDHPGYSNVYVNNENLEISERYDKKSPLEHHSVACFRDLCAKHNLLEHLTQDDRQRVDRMVEVLILRTDMAHHADLTRAVATELEQIDRAFLDTTDGVDLVLSLALKCADISNQARPWKVACKWNLAVYREFWREGDADEAKGRKINPIHVRSTKKGDIAQKSVGFIKFVVVPLYETYRDLIVKCAAFRDGLNARVVNESLSVLTTNLEHYQLEADGLHVPQDGLADRPGICGPQQLELEQRRFSRTRKTRLLLKHNNKSKNTRFNSDAAPLDDDDLEVVVDTPHWQQRSSTTHRQACSSSPSAAAAPAPRE